MNDFGLTLQQFLAKGRADIEASLQDALRDQFEEPYLDFGPESTLGRLVNVETERLLELWQTAQDVHDAGRLATAHGASLDRLAETLNLFRLDGRPTQVMAHLSGKEGTVVPAGSLAKVERTQALFQATQETVITREKTVAAVMRVTEAQAQTKMAVNVNGVWYPPENAPWPAPWEMAEEGNEHGLISGLDIDGFLPENFPSGDLFWEVAKEQVYDEETGDLDHEYLQFRVFKDKNKKWLVLKSAEIGIPGGPPDTGPGPQDLEEVNGSGLSGTVTITHYVEDDDSDNVLRWRPRPDTVANEIRSQLAAGLGVIDFDIDSDDDMISIVTLKEPFSIDVGEHAELVSFVCEQPYASLEKAEVPCGEGDLSVIETPVSGWEGLTNAEAGFNGRALETDAILRERIRNSPRINARASAGAMEQRLVQEVEVIDAAFVFENRTDEIVEGQPAHSIHVIVDAVPDSGNGEDEAIARKIWELKPAGIRTWHPADPLVPISILDDSGVLRDVCFSRPAVKYIWVKVTVLNPAIEPDSWDDERQAIVDNILKLGHTYSLGQGIAIQRFYEPVLEVEGLRHVRIEMAVTENLLDPAPDPIYGYTITDKIAIAPMEKAIFAEGRITVSF